MKCQFAFPGTYGHECGKPATLVAVSICDGSDKNSAVSPPPKTKSGLFYGGRCAECAQVRGGENREVIRFEQAGLTHQINEWT